ncbi:FecR domain-containing protein [Fibrella sp. HMF5335]|uniref:FecR domain-containing protein n=1 Tax=Fibrella rubiginis TaxID=2817060 RepID=A0A939GK40_9BACT|nr:FecR domain-containing protein [Fibrella rubiginis]MBO0939796.1 FecR domain-containing protein [Fibrella rubiginis]
MNHSTYSAVDFALDEHFRRWVIDPTHETEAYWQSFLAKHPEQQVIMAEARALIGRIHVNVEAASPDTLQRMWSIIQQHAEQPGIDASAQLAGPQRIHTDDNVVPLTGSRSWWRSGGLRVAAILAGLLVLGGLLWQSMQTEKPVAYHTAFGKTQTVALPDGSVVTLNGNSTLTLSPNWNKDQMRLVTLDGEAFFTVAKHRDQTGQPVKFRVKTPDLTVEVLGTQFNVSRRHDQTEVVLQEGRVQVTEAQTNASPTLMQPGERLTYSGLNGKLTKTTVDTRLYTSWQTNMLIFRDKPVTEIAQLLADNYGIAIEFKNKDMATARFSGSVPADSVVVFFAKIEKLYGVSVRQEGQRYIIE